MTQLDNTNDIKEIFVKMLISAAIKADNMTAFIEGEKIVLIPPEELYYMPELVIKDKCTVDKLLAKYIFAIRNSNIQSSRIDKKHDIGYFMFLLIKNMSNSDYIDFEDYIKRCTCFFEDNSFSFYDVRRELGESNQNKFYAKRTQEYYGFETPYVMSFYAKNKCGDFKLPLVRYGICEENHEKVAYIYCIQRKKIYSLDGAFSTIESEFDDLKKGANGNRNITRSMLGVLTMFLGMLKQEGINKVKVVDYVPRRFGRFRDVVDDENRECIQSSATNKFLGLFIRVYDQLIGSEITAYPYDIDSFLHMNLANNMFSDNEKLNLFYNIGYEPKEKLK